MNEQQSLHDSQYKLFVRAFSSNGGENTLKKSVSLIDSEFQTFLEGEENHNTQKKNRKLRIQWLWC